MRNCHRVWWLASPKRVQTHTQIDANPILVLVLILFAAANGAGRHYLELREAARSVSVAVRVGLLSIGLNRVQVEATMQLPAAAAEDEALCAHGVFDLHHAIGGVLHLEVQVLVPNDRLGVIVPATRGQRRLLSIGAAALAALQQIINFVQRHLQAPANGVSAEPGVPIEIRRRSRLLDQLCSGVLERQVGPLASHGCALARDADHDPAVRIFQGNLSTQQFHR
mmetsp:Transcript_9997/g.22539  ORF Transcript_9997/g.22539 Transcript_9997/m.22539 type:complete len:224 (-) Transcript_9997:123-794(-)